MKERKQSYFKKVGKSLPKIIDKNIKERNFVEITLIKQWKEIIGQDIAKYCWPIKIVFSDIKNSNGIIFLKTKRGRSMEIEFKNDEIIEKLNQYFGYKAINKISVVQDFNIKDSYKKKIIKKKIKNNHSKVINKIKKNELKIALQNLSKTLFDQ
tara:strand:+ start:1215 stop:1676 length:462 start_codon:yes stop_codon:yes gene_type:complete